MQIKYVGTGIDCSNSNMLKLDSDVLDIRIPEYRAVKGASIFKIA